MCFLNKSIIKTFIFLITTFTLCFHTFGYWQPDIISKENLSVTLNSAAANFSTDLIIIDDHAFFPLRDLLPLLGFEMQYLLKDDYYLLRQPKYQIRAIVVPNSKEFWINDSQYFLCKQTLYFENRLYVPLRDFFSYLGYTVHVINNKEIKIYGSLKKLQASETVTQTDFNLKYSPQIDSFRLPILEKDRKIHLFFNKQLFNLQNNYIYQNKDLYLDLTKLLKKLDYKITKTATTVTISKNNRGISYFKNKPAITIKDKNSSKDYYVEKPIIFKNNRFYLLFSTFLHTFNFHAEWDSKNRFIHLLKPVEDIQLQKLDNNYQLTISSNHGLDYQHYKTQSWPNNSISFDLPETVSFFKPASFAIKAPPLNRATLIRKNRYTTNFKLEFSAEVVAKIKKTSQKIILNFFPIINQLYEYSDNDYQYVKIHSSMPIKYKYWKDTKRPRLVIDIPNSINKLPSLYKGYNYIYQRIRTAQLSLSPSITRIVLDLYEMTNFKITQPEENIILLKLKKPKTLKNRIIKKPGLEDKVIVLDAGHGGIDPGAISRINKYEKNYTLDITKELKRLLEYAGAIVVMAREGDQNPSLAERTDLANKNHADAFISIHLNSFFKSYAHGTETYYYKHHCKKLANTVQKEMIEELKLRNNGIKKNNLYVLTHANVPSILIEPGFLTSPLDEPKIRTREFRKRIGKAVFKGLEKYFQ